VSRLNIFSQESRSSDCEILDGPGIPEDVAARAYDELQRTHDWLGNTAAILRLLRRDPIQVCSVLDIGCGRGALLNRVREQFGVEVIGFDLRPASGNAGVTIVSGNAAQDPLPHADVALLICVAHHLSETELTQLIRNVGRSCRRLILLDLVRHWLPLALFRVFVSPLLSNLNAQDGVTSLRRAFTANELRRVVDTALENSTAKVRYSVNPFYIRQVVDISW
jgi:SAM-dependent methyltransferase